MTERVEIRLPDAIKTHFCGESLAKTLYNVPVDIHCIGGLGAGKTTFLQGLATGLGIPEAITSPTFALEQRYRTAQNIPFVHIDCYRLSAPHARELLRATDDHGGIRCIEWADRAELPPENAIRIHLREDGNGRSLTCDFGDAPLPTDADVERWRAEVWTPPHVAAHCDAVASVTEKLSDALLASGTIVRREALRLGGRLHDLLRYIDFWTDPPDLPPETLAAWSVWREAYKGVRHEPACTQFLTERGFPMLGTIIEPHGLRLPSPPRVMIEQQLLFYADKRVAFDRVVTLRGRFDDFQQRYGNSEKSRESDIWYTEAVGVEKQLFPDGPPL